MKKGKHKEKPALKVKRKVSKSSLVELEASLAEILTVFDRTLSDVGLRLADIGRILSYVHNDCAKLANHVIALRGNIKTILDEKK